MTELRYGMQDQANCYRYHCYVKKSFYSEQPSFILGKSFQPCLIYVGFRQCNDNYSVSQGAWIIAFAYNIQLCTLEIIYIVL
jgi:hypothetical protein